MYSSSDSFAYDDYFYYIEVSAYESDDYKLYRTNLDESNKIKLSDDPAMDINVLDN